MSTVPAPRATPEVVALARQRATEAGKLPRTDLAWRSVLIGAITAIPSALIIPAATHGRLVLAAIALGAAMIAVWIVPRLVIRPRNYWRLERRAFDELGWCAWCHGRHTWEQCVDPERPRR
jgi:hypothetical protein